MATNYPNALDAFVNPAATDTLDKAGVLHDVQHANANDAIKAVQTELGTKPRDTYASVAARLTALATAAAAAQSAALSASAPVSYPLTISGTGDAVVGALGGRVYNDTGAARKIGTIRATLASAPAGSSFVVDVLKNDASILGASKLAVTAGSLTATTIAATAAVANIPGSGANGATTGGSETVTLTRVPLQSSLMIAGYASHSSDTTGVSGLGATWTKLPGFNGSSNNYTQLWVGRFTGAPAGKTVTVAGTTGSTFLNVIEVAGADTTATPAVFAGGANSGYNSPTGTPSAAIVANTGDLVLTFAYVDTFTSLANQVPGSWTLAPSAPRSTLAYRVATGVAETNSVSFMSTFGTTGMIGALVKAGPAIIGNGEYLTATVTQVGSSTPGTSPTVQVTVST